MAASGASTTDSCPGCGGSGRAHYAEQIGAEATPTEFVDALIDCTREWMRVVKPSGSIWVNLGDKYEGGGGTSGHVGEVGGKGQRTTKYRNTRSGAVPTKSLIGIPWRYAIRCIDELGLILRAEVIWSKPNGLPESVTDRVRRSHEQWFHFSLEPRYYSAVDEVREATNPANDAHAARYREAARTYGRAATDAHPRSDGNGNGIFTPNPLGKLPGSVWTIPTEPLHVPDHLGVDHFAAFPTEWPRRIIQGWSPEHICTACGEGRRPVVESWLGVKERDTPEYGAGNHGSGRSTLGSRGSGARILGYACACPEPTAPTTPGVVLDPFGGTGTTALVASVLGRKGISNDMSSDYNRIAEWRTTDPKQRAKAARKPYTPPAEQTPGQISMFDLDGDAS